MTESEKSQKHVRLVLENARYKYKLMIGANFTEPYAKSVTYRYLDQMFENYGKLWAVRDLKEIRQAQHTEYK